MTPAEKQEFYRLARRLSDEGAFLSPEGKRYVLMVKRNKWKKPVMNTGRHYVEKFISSDLIVMDKEFRERLRISPTGRAFYRRHLNGVDPFRGQHQVQERGDDGITRNLTETPLSWLQARNRAGGISFTQPEFMAGERLRADYEAGQMPGKMSIDLTRLVVRGGRRIRHEQHEPPAYALDARKRLRDALEAVGPDLDTVLVKICCELNGLNTIEKEMGWPRRSGKLALKLALSRLAVHYGLQSRMAASASARIRETME